MISYWLMKSEPEVFSIEHLRRKKVAGWDGVRNYQARNYLRAMRKDDLAFFYHSSVKPPAIVGLMEIVREAYPDPTAHEPGWVQVDVQFVKAFSRMLSLDEIKKTPSLQTMMLLKRSRLSVQPVTPAEWKLLMKILDPQKD
jgi:predicted RNA-binding protein with PUA-like domain